MNGARGVDQVSNDESGVLMTDSKDSKASIPGKVAQQAMPVVSAENLLQKIRDAQASNSEKVISDVRELKLERD